MDNLDNLRFPEGKIDLPPSKVPLKTYIDFVIFHLNNMGTEKIRQELSRRPFPSGKRFTLFPEQ